MWLNVYIYHCDIQTSIENSVFDQCCIMQCPSLPARQTMFVTCSIKIKHSGKDKLEIGVNKRAHGGGGGLPCFFTLLRSMHVAECTQAEPISTRRIDIPVDGYIWTVRWYFEHFPNLGIELEISNRTPVFRCRLSRQTLLVWQFLHLACT